MSTLTTGMTEQYSDSQKLAARARLTSKYTISETPWFPWVIGRLPLEQHARILDVGCGPAWLWEAAADILPAELSLTLTDLSPGMVAEAKARCETLPLGSLDSQVADAAALPFETASFDGVVAMHMLYHLPDPAIAIAEMHRVLRPGGFVAVTTNGANNMRRLYGLTAAFGGPPCDPAAMAFGFEHAETMLKARFGNVATHRHPTHMRITSAEDLFLALTSYPPGDRATTDQLVAFRGAIEALFAEEGGTVHVDKETGLFLAIKA